MLENITIPANGKQARPDTFRYDYQVDLNADTNLAKVARHVGENKRVLELGCATGYMSRALRERGCTIVAVEMDAHAAERARAFCERIIIGNLDRMDLSKELGADRFDVVVASDVLEHLQDPPALVSALKKFLRPDGYLVASIPNIAHGSVRLALLGGEFPYSERGLLDRTHLRFYTRRTLEQLFEFNGYIIQQLERQLKPIAESNVPFDAAVLPDGLLEKLSQDPEALTYQFIVVAAPTEERKA